MNYSTEIRSIMRQGYHLNVEINAYKKDHEGDSEYHQFVGLKPLSQRLKQLSHRADELRRQAAEEFAALYGWRCSRSHFGVKTLLRGGVHDGYPRSHFDYRPDLFSVHYDDLFDHAVFFRETARPYRAVAIIGQPYSTDVAAAIVTAAAIRLALHVPSDIDASWHYPGWTRFFCFTRPEIERVHFLPEQIEVASEKEPDATEVISGGR